MYLAFAGKKIMEKMNILYDQSCSWELQWNKWHVLE